VLDLSGVRVTAALAMPCRTDEPSLGATLQAVAAAWGQGGLEPRRLVVCVNGPGGPEVPIVATLRAFAADHALPFALFAVDDAHGAMPAVWSGVRVLRTGIAGKARAWNWLRRTTETATLLVLDADVDFAPAVPAQLLAALEAHPHATLASARTQPIVRPRWLERVQAVPYAFPFANLSPQLYAARRDALPLGMPEDLLDPERWLELMVGRDRIVHAAEAVVHVHLAATVRDFFRQRVRLEQAKLQLSSAYPGLAGRGQPEPGRGAVRQHFSTADLARLAAYLGLRMAATAVAHWRHRTGRLEVAWQQATSTKERR
jgi:hypothetical protein